MSARTFQRVLAQECRAAGDDLGGVADHVEAEILVRSRRHRQGVEILGRVCRSTAAPLV
jgi:hypothetical protein